VLARNRIKAPRLRPQGVDAIDAKPETAISSAQVSFSAP
jgi:hypothetical protein